MIEQDEAAIAKWDAQQDRKRAEIVQAISHFLGNELDKRHWEDVVEGVIIALFTRYGLNTVTRAFRHHFGGDGK